MRRKPLEVPIRDPENERVNDPLDMVCWRIFMHFTLKYAHFRQFLPHLESDNARSRRSTFSRLPLLLRRWYISFDRGKGRGRKYLERLLRALP